MCHKLFQTYGCGHTREVCTTPCVHALSTATPATTPSPELPGSDLDTKTLIRPGLAIFRRPSTDSVTSLPPTSTLANKGRLSLAPQVTQGIRTSSLCNLTSTLPRGPLSFAPSRLRDSVVTADPPPYTQAASSRQMASLPTLSFTQATADPALGPDEIEMIPNFCAQSFARYLPTGCHPCYDCYMKPEYELARQKWMRIYADIHPGCKPEDVERMSGIEDIARNLGLVNIAREVNTAESGKVEAVQEETKTQKME